MTFWTQEELSLLTARFHAEPLHHFKALLLLGCGERNALLRLDSFMKRENAKVIDIRYSPRSRWQPAFNKAALIERYGATRYEHCQALGNVNYNKQGEPIQLFAPFEGMCTILSHLQKGHPLVLLCACKNYKRCHRKTVLELLRATLVELRNAG